MERPSNWSTLKETEKTWQLHAMSDAGQNHGPEAALGKSVIFEWHLWVGCYCRISIDFFIRRVIQSLCTRENLWGETHRNIQGFLQLAHK